MAVALTLASDDTWSVTTSFDAEWSCSSGCSTDELVVYLPTDEDNETTSLSGELTLPSFSGQSVAGATAGTTGTQLMWTLDETISPGDIVSVQVTYDKVTAGTTRSLMGCLLEASWVGPLCTFSYGNTSTGDDLEGFVLARLPALPRPSLTTHLAPTTRFDLSPTTTMSAPVGLAPGEPDATYEVFGPWAGLREETYAAIVFPELVQDVTISGSGAHQVHGWTDTLAALSHTAWLRRTTTEDSLDGDLDWLEDRLGSLPHGDIHLVLMQTNHAVGIDEGLGLSVPGIGIVLVEDTDGNILLGGDEEAAGLHELAHAWIGLGTGTDITTDTGQWLLEGATTLLEWERYATATTSIRADQVPYFYNPSGLEELVGANYQLGHVLAEAINMSWCFSGESVASLERGESTRLLHYQMGAYVLTQALYTYLGKGGDEDSFWVAVAATFASGDDVDADAVETLFTTTLELPAFYDEWIGPDAYGIPMMYVRELTWGESGAYLDSVRIGQAQVDMYDHEATCPYGEMQPLDDVPYFLRCFTDADPDNVVFDECQASADTLHDPAPVLFDSGTTGTTALQWVALTPIGTVSGDQPLPAHFGIVADDMLFPGLVPTVGWDHSAAWDTFRAPLYCTPDQVDAGTCGADADLDKAPDGEGDCDPTDASIGPEEAIQDGYHRAGIDNNCDTWIGEYP